MSAVDRISWITVAGFCILLGLAPFTPEPHVWEKLKMLAAGELTQALDIFDLVMHGSPWVLAIVKGIRALRA